MNHKLLFHVDNIKNRKPVALTVDCTGRCNLDCPFCFAKDRVKLDLDLEIIKHVVNNMPSLKSIELGIAEPLLYKDFDAMMGFFNEKKLAVSLGTNGILLSEVPDRILKMIKFIFMGATHYIDNNNMASFDWLPVPFNIVIVYHKGSLKGDTISTSCTSWRTDFVDRVESFYELNKEARSFQVRLDMNASVSTAALFDDLSFFTNKITKINTPAKFKSYNGICYYANLKPMLCCDGNIYPCCVETEGLDYSKRYKICRWDEVRDVYGKDVIVDCIHCSKVESLQCMDNFLNDPDKEFII